MKATSDSRELLRQTASNSKSNGEQLMQKGNVNAALQKFDEALRLFSRFESNQYTDHEIADIDYMRALCLIKQSNFGEAIIALEQAATKNSENNLTKSLLAKTRLELQYKTKRLILQHKAEQNKISSPKASTQSSWTLPLESIKWVVDSRMDPTGRIFHHEGEFYRAIYPGAAPKVKRLFESGVIESLTEKRLLIKSQITDLKVPGFGLVVHHKKIPFISMPEDWPKAIFLDAAKTVIKTNLALLEFGYSTIDFHSHNIQQTCNAAPVWMDFGSIVPLNAYSGMICHTEFCEWFVHYLILLSKDYNLERVCRTMMRFGGINADEFKALTGKQFAVSTENREHWLRSVMNWLENVSFPKQRTQWGLYYEEKNKFQLPDLNDDNFKRPNTRTGIIYELISKHKPREVVDIACNAGLFSVLAAQDGANVCAIDYDPTALETFYQLLSEEKQSLPITIIQRDICDTRNQNLRPIKGDFVMTLALTHHLFLTQKLSFNSIAHRLSSYSTDILLTEFMPDGLGVGSPTPNPLPREYTLDNFKKSFSPYFKKISTIEYPSGKSRRIFVLCEKRTLFNEMVITPS